MAEKAISERPEVIFHLAGVVSGEAELDFDKGYRVNLDGTRALLEAIRKAGDGYKPRVIFTSSMAVFGAPFPHAIPDEFHLTPLTSYGTQKAMCEAMLADYTRQRHPRRRRHPAAVDRGAARQAEQGRVRLLLRHHPRAAGRRRRRVLPVADTVVHTHASPRSAVGFLVHAAELARDKIEPHINLTMPGVCCTVAEQIEALRRVAGDKVAARIRREPDALIVRIVAGWPQPLRGQARDGAGISSSRSTFDEIIRVHIDEDLGGKFAA